MSTANLDKALAVVEKLSHEKKPQLIAPGVHELRESRSGKGVTGESFVTWARKCGKGSIPKPINKIRTQ